MKRTKGIVLGLLSTLALIAMAIVSSSAAQKAATYTGDIMDSACAAMGSHDAMIKGTKMTAKDCTLACVKKGAKFVLYDADTKTVYQLSNQNLPMKYAGEKVTVTGKLDDSTKTITESKITAAT